MSAPGPGKFEACGDLETAERLYSLSLQGGCDEEFHSEGGWCGLLADAILIEDAQGFFSYVVYETEAEARATWDASDVAA